MYRINGYDIELTRGDTLFFKVNLSGRELPEGSVAYFTVKSNPRSAEELIHKKMNASDGVLDIRLMSEDTDLTPRTYYWDVRVLIPLEDGGYEVETPMEYAAFTVLDAIGSAGDDGQPPGMDADLPVLSVVLADARSLMEELRAAAENGEFDGDRGPKGDKGDPGDTPVIEAAFATINEDYTGIPSVVAGVSGEKTVRFYFDFYNIRGAKGDRGPAGPSGEKGANGDSGRSPIIGENGNWFVYDDDQSVYVDTGVYAGGASTGLPAVSTEDNGKVLTVVGGKWEAKPLPLYDGAYSVTPSTTGTQTMRTAGKLMDADITVQKIPYFETSNTSDGVTVIIGSEV